MEPANQRHSIAANVIAKLHFGGYNQQILRGIVSYAHQSRNWRLFCHIGGATLDEALPMYPQAAGLITSTVDATSLAELEKWAHSRPVVLVEQDSVLGLPVVRADNYALGQLAYEHLSARGFMDFGYLGPEDANYSMGREAGFFDAAVEAGHQIWPTGGSHYPTAQRTQSAWFDTKEYLAELPRPVALMADSSYHGQRIGLACLQQNIAIPEEVAVIAVDDIDVLCEGCVPPLTAINAGTFQIGYQAAALLDRLMTGESPQSMETLVPPAGLTERQSTNTSAITNQHLRQALQFIRERACDAITTEDVLRAVPISRRQLETLFRRQLGRTIHHDILRVRLSQVQSLLRTTNLPMAEIAIATGFEYPTNMSHAFKREHGITPSEYRRGHREF